MNADVKIKSIKGAAQFPGRFTLLSYCFSGTYWTRVKANSKIF